MTTSTLTENNSEEISIVTREFSPMWPFTQGILREDVNTLYTHSLTPGDFEKNIPMFQIYECEGKYVCGVHNFIADQYKLDRTFILEDTIGNHVDIVLLGVNDNKPIRGKVDTGAACCSMHATNIHISDKTVEFDLGNSRYRLNLEGNQQIQTADNGTENRPVVLFNCKMNGELIKNVQVNLNDRTGLEPFLVGQNLLKQTNAKIDPKLEHLVEQCLSHLS